MPLSVEFAAPAVLILVDDASLADRCRAALEPGNARLWIGWGQTPADVTFDVIVVGGQWPAASQHGEPAIAALKAPGVVALGTPLPDADVVLPIDFLPRELLTACQLLTAIVRLRRQLADGQLAGSRLQQEANRDALTQLPNRRAWEQELALRLASGAPQPLGLALVDVDHFKQVNDGWGHAAGDQLLVATGNALRQSLRQDDFVARLGGDEFGLLLSGLEPAAMAAVLERVQAGLPARIGTGSRQVASVSIGYSCCLAAATVTSDELTRAADEALRQAKRQGRHRVVASMPRTK